ncbi:unnamed protein product [Spirodela intermedia]|uniref:Zinc-finger domain-containing protein n=1 Tax=Spirodela intermedia TaxID=51605 RepID=A0A7I8JXM7_SPIIN|nr:unnamed protein product [Spirodela intermedia]
MVSTRARTVETPSMPKREGMVAAGATPPPACLAGRRSGEWEGKSGTSLEYERCREERIRENMERMQKMGILDLALKFKSSVSGSSPASKGLQSRRSTPSPAKLTKDLPPRRSSRLQHATQISYSEIEVKRKDKSQFRGSKISVEERAKEEIYTDEHQDLLGDREASWTLFVDGYDKNGARIYDPVRGKTCHQCRQKTLGYRTHCSSCNLVQGQFCGDCLYMRYGENVLEAIKNPGWVCPVCRDICNCSLCRTKKGWAPTGCLYKKVVSLGFKSVAHFLIQTRRHPVDGDGEVVPALPVSAQRSLPFTDEEEPARTTENPRKRRKKEAESTPGAEETMEKVGDVDGEKGSHSPDEDVAKGCGEERTQGREEPDRGCVSDRDRRNGGKDQRRTSADSVAGGPTESNQKPGGNKGRSRGGRLLPVDVMRPSPDSIAGRLRSRMKV